MNAQQARIEAIIENAGGCEGMLLTDAVALIAEGVDVSAMCEGTHEEA